MEQWRVIHGDCLDILPTLDADSVDAVICDPPYGIKIDDYNGWDCGLSRDRIDAFHAEITRLTSGFYAVFGQMPTLAAWHESAIAHGFHFCEHITWIKRTATPMHRLNRGHESIYIYAVGKRRMFYTTRGPYEDVKLPGVLVDIVTLEGIDRHIKELRMLANGRQPAVHFRGAAPSLINRKAKFGHEHITPRAPETANFTNVWSFLPARQRLKSQEDFHPTQKPIEIMQRLAEMLTPPNGLILDPFTGSGSTGCAAVLEGFRFVGIEREAEYVEIARRRIAHWAAMPKQATFFEEAGGA